MTEYRRKRLPGGYYFFTVVTHKRQRFLTDENARHILRCVWKDVSARWPFKTVALCLLSEHLHCVWKLPDGDSDFSTRWSLIKSGFTRQWLEAVGREGRQSASRTKERRRGIWHRRFWEHCIRDERDLAEHIRYIHYNPVKHKLVNRPGDWIWSSYHRYQRESLTAQPGGLDVIATEPSEETCNIIRE